MANQSVLATNFRDLFTQLVTKESLASLLLATLAAHIIYNATKRYVKRRVSGRNDEEARR